MERFLRYSLEKGRRIRVVLMRGGQLTQTPASVTALQGETATLLLRAGSPPITVPLSDILSCDYARGDHGED